MFSLTENQKKIAFALLIAVLLWGYASNQTANIFNYGEEKTASYLIDLETRYLPENYVLKSVSEDKVVVRADYVSYFSQMTKEDIKAYVNLRNLSPGDNMKIIEVELPSDARLLNVDPGYIIVNVAKKKSENNN